MTNIFNNKNITLNLALFILVILILYSGRVLFVPMFYGLFIAIILYPVCKKLESHNINRTISIAIGLLAVTLLFAVLTTLLFLELNSFRSTLPQIQARLQPLLAQLQQKLSEKFEITASIENEWIKALFQQLSNNIGYIFRSSLNTLSTFLLTPVFTALFLYNRRDFVLFITSLFNEDNKKSIMPILHTTIHTYFNFCKGMVWVYIIVGVLNSLGLMALGIQNAILFGFLTAVMTIIPYVGIVVSALLPISIAWITKESIWYPVGVMAMFTFVQYLEANVIFPRVVASQIKVSTWATLVAIIGGSILWGVAGMILLIPLISILKIIADHIPEWRPLKILLSRSEDLVSEGKSNKELVFKNLIQMLASRRQKKRM